MLGTLRLNEKVFRGVAFDLEGTTVSLEPLHWQSHREVARTLGVTLPTETTEVMKRIPSFVGGPDRAVMEEIKAFAKTRGIAPRTLDQWPVEKMTELKDALFDAKFKKAHLEPREGVARTMQMIEALGVPYGVCSVTRSLQAESILEQSGLREALAGRPVLLRHHVARGKPAPDVYLEAAKNMGIRPEDLLVFEDSPIGVKAAVAAGATVFAVPVTSEGDEKQTTALARVLKEAGAMNVFQGWKEVNQFLEKNALISLEGAKPMQEGVLVRAFAPTSARRETSR